jgi:phenylacetate-CoA ligase
MGMSSYGLHLANHAESMGIDLAGSSVEKIICSAEPLSKAKRAKLERSWGAEVYDAFGMTEACLMGGEDAAHDGFRIWTDMFHIEVLDLESRRPVGVGETGTLVLTPLWTFGATPFIRWNSGDIVSHYPGGAGDGAFSVFPIVKHAHRTAGFFKVRGVNINHSEFEDFLFAHEQVQDFKAEIVTVKDLDRLRVSVEFRRGSDESALITRIATAIKQTFEVSPAMVTLERGTLAVEFESAIKAPRFQDNRA